MLLGIVAAYRRGRQTRVPSAVDRSAVDVPGVQCPTQPPALNVRGGWVGGRAGAVGGRG